MPKYLIIVNPISGRGNGGRSIPEIEALLKQYKLDYRLVQTEKPLHAVELAEKAAREKMDVVVTASGDGTANEVLNGLMQAHKAGHRRTAMCILPVGTGNDFAYGMGIRADLADSIRVLAANKRIRMDVGLVKGGDYPKGRYFGNGVGVGFDAAVGFEAVKIRWTRGLLAYLIATLRTVFLYFKAPTVRVRFGDQELVVPALMVSIMNGQRMGGGFFMAPDGRPDDGTLNLCVARQVSKARVFGLIPHFMKGTQASQPEITTGLARKVTVTAVSGKLPAHCDGETLCYEGTELEIELLPGVIDFVTSAEYGGK